MQDYPRIEHIIMDGGSEDGTRELLKENPHLIWVSEPDRGQSHALNKGFQRAQGEIIGWLNADDTYQPGAVSTAAQFLLVHEDVDLVYSDLQIINEDSQPVGITRSQPFDLVTLLFENHIKQPTVFMRRHVLEKLGGLNESLHYVMDWEFWLRAGLAGFKIQYLPGQVLANFRLCPGTKSFEQTPSFQTEWYKILEQAFESPYFYEVSQATKRDALQKSRAKYHMANMIQAVERRERLTMFRHLFQAALQDWSLIFNRGTWMFVGKGILGLKINRLRKYEKHNPQHRFHP